MAHRFFFQNFHISGNKLTISDPQTVRQITKVLRLGPGDEFIVFSDKTEYLLSLEYHDSKYVETVILNQENPDREIKLDITIYQALLKKDKFEWVLQKGAELGARKFIPLVTDNTITREITANKMARYRKILAEATEQCGGRVIPDISRPQTFNEALIKAAGQNRMNILAWEGEKKMQIKELISKKHTKFNVFIGPEGGFSEREIHAAKKNNLTTVSLGRRILRAETAAIALISILVLGK